MSTVLEVITVLEGTTITKEQLETTRLAKYINQLRRKTSNDQLARRSKNLLKKWREMVIPNQNTAQQQSSTNAPLTHPSSAISPKSISSLNQGSNRLVGNSSLSNGGTPTTPHPSTWPSHSHGHPGIKGAVLSKENMIRRPMPTTPQSSVQHKSSSMPMTGATTPKFPLPILNTNNGSNSSLAASHAPVANTATINSTKLTSRLSSAQPISFANLISQAEINQHIDGPHKVNPNTNSSNRNIHTIDITSNLSQSPKMPKIPRRNNVSGATVSENNRSASPKFLIGNRTSNFRLPPHNDIDDANSRPSFTNLEHPAKVDQQPNNHSRKTFNGFGNIFKSNAKVSSVPSVPFPSSELHDSHSGSSSMVMAPVSASLPIATTVQPASSIGMTERKRHRQEKNKDRSSHRMKGVTSLGGTSFDNSISNSSSLGMFNSTTNTTNTTNLGNVAPSIHKLSELTFTGKFSKSDDAIINIDTTSGSSSPKQMIGGRADSPILMQDSPCGSPMVSVDNSNESVTGDSLLKSSNQLLAATTAPIVAVPLETLNTSKFESSNMPIPKKRGRKKGSTGVDRNMSLAGPSSGQPIFGSVSVLKSKMDSMRSVKKVKTTKELLAELQNRKPTLTGNGSTNSSPMLELPAQSLVSPSSLCSG